MTWRSICWGKKLLIQGLRKRIGNGRSTKAFKDLWLPRPPFFLPITNGDNDDRKVSEFIQHPGKWNIDLIQQSYLILDSQLILTIPLSPFDHSDSWFWNYNSNGCYSVKSGYNLAISVNRAEPSSSTNVVAEWWKAFWAIKIPKKILLFAWRGYHEILPTKKGLYRRNVSLNSNCPLCGFGEDFNAHAVYWCIFSQEVWKLMKFPFLLGYKEEISFKGVLLYATELLEKEDFTKMLIVAWRIWSERNKRSHGQQQKTAMQIKSWLLSFIDEIKNVHSSEVGARRMGEFHSANQVVVENPGLALFVDAAISTSSQKVGLGAVIYTSNNRVQARLSKPLEGTLLVLHAEGLALLVGLQWVLGTSLTVKRISTDSLLLVQSLNNNTIYHSELGIFLLDIRMLLANFLGVVVTHIGRKYNVAAHNLAKHALELQDEVS